MKTEMSRFSLSAYADLRDAGELSRLERVVFDTVVLHGPMTREEIEAQSGIRLSSVCGRVNKLLEKGVFCEVGSKKNPVSGKPNGLVDLSLAEIDRRSSPINTKCEALAIEGFDFAQTEALV